MKSVFAVFGIFLTLTASAQQFQRCATTEAVEWRESNFPGYKRAVENTYHQVKEIIAQKGLNDWDTIYQIPVVVHIVYNTPEENISDELVHSEIARLNKDYRRLNADTTDTRSEFLPVAADAGIEFYLAGTDPNGAPSGGITRTQTSRTDFAPDLFGGGLDDVKQSSMDGADAWDTQNYLNIWVCDLIGSGSFFQVFGFAYPPATAPNWPANSSAPSSEFEGVVIHYEVFGDGNPLAVGPLAVADKGRTAVHEVGHYLGLRHIWGDSFFDGCAQDDGLEDTPNAASNAAQVCNFSNNTCTDSPVDFPDMIENYMDYAQDQCMNLFTEDQVAIMRSMLATARVNLADGSVAPSGLTESSIDPSNIAIFPNPSSGQFQYQITGDVNLDRLELFDLHGRLILSYPKSSIPSNQMIDLQVNSGVYLMKFEFAEGVAVKRLTIQ